uniref:Uncharacterized protein n=1 Tax=Strongyloides stercoralis TaxID=6248 RepID=A0A0K0ETQ8_STRER
MKAVVEEVGGCCSTGAESKTCKLFFGRNSFRINASYDSETRYYCCCFGYCCSTGTDSEALRLFWKKLEDVPILQLSRKHRKAFPSWVGSCCSTGANSGECKLFWSELETYSTGTESRAWKMLWKKLEAVALLELNRKRVNFFLGGIRLELVLVTIVKPDIIVAVLEAVIQLELNLENGDFSVRNSRIHYCYCFGGCYSTVTAWSIQASLKKTRRCIFTTAESEAWKLFCKGFI